MATLFLLFSLFIFQPEASALPHNKAGDDFVIKRGTNISHWLSQSDARGDERKNYFTEKDVKYLAGLGFDHLRIPVDEVQLWQENGQKDEEGFSLLQDALNWCKEYKLKAVVDLHILRSHHFNEKVKPLWTQPAAQEKIFSMLAGFILGSKKISGG